MPSVDPLTATAERLASEAAQIAAALGKRLGRDPSCGSREAIDELASRLAPLLEQLGRGLQSGGLDLADAEWRELLGQLAMLGGWLAGQDASPSLIAAFTPALSAELTRRAGAPLWLVPGWRGLERTLAATLTETFCRGREAEHRRQVDRLLEERTPVVRLPGEVSALLLVGQPGRELLSGICGRLLMEVARYGSARLLVDFTNAGPLQADALGVLVELFWHRKLAQREIIIVAAPDQLKEALAQDGRAMDHLTLCRDWPAAHRVLPGGGEG